MAYNGSTASSSLANPPRCIAGGMVVSALGSTVLLGNGSTAADAGIYGGQVWTYVSTDEVSTVVTTGYFTDGEVLGMKPGDFVLGAYHSTAGSSVEAFFGVVTSVSSNGASVRAGTLASSA